MNRVFFTENMKQYLEQLEFLFGVDPLVMAGIAVGCALGGYYYLVFCFTKQKLSTKGSDQSDEVVVEPIVEKPKVVDLDHYKGTGETSLTIPESASSKERKKFWFWPWVSKPKVHYVRVTDTIVVQNGKKNDVVFLKLGKEPNTIFVVVSASDFRKANPLLDFDSKDI